MLYHKNEYNKLVKAVDNSRFVNNQDSSKKKAQSNTKTKTKTSDANLKLFLTEHLKVYHQLRVISNATQ